MADTDNKPFREKYFDEAFPPWSVCEGEDGTALINADDWYGSVNTKDAEALCAMHTRLRMLLWEAVKHDYERFTELRDM